MTVIGVKSLITSYWRKKVGISHLRVVDPNKIKRITVKLICREYFINFRVINLLLFFSFLIIFVPGANFNSSH